MTANELDTTAGSAEELGDKLLDAGEGAASQDQVTYLKGENGLRYAAIVPVEAAEEYERHFEFEPGAANVFADPYSDKLSPIGRDVMIQFGDTETGAFMVELKDGELKIRFHSLIRVSIGVLPESSNSVTLRSLPL
jgi:hypothetical protein